LQVMRRKRTLHEGAYCLHESDSIAERLEALAEA
jgi:hypothetical protein